jgi:hypothetical protein
MGRSVKEQVKSGFRIGGGLAVFFVAMAPLVDGLRRVVWAAPQHQLVWSPIGLVELIVAAALLVPTAKVWMLWLGGSLLFGLVKGVFLLTTGGPSPRLETAGLVFVFLLTLILMGSIALIGTTLSDRVALTIYVFSLGWSADKGLLMPSPSLAVGLAVLFASWCVHYWKQRGTGKGWPRPDGASHREEE